MTQAIIVKREGAFVVTASGAEVVASLLAQARDALSDIQPVIDDLENVNTVADNIANVNTVAARDADIGTVADRDADIGTVATNAADVQTVADNIADVTLCADNMAAILAAPDAAADALSAASSVFITSYAHEFSVGDRTVTAVADGGSFTTGLVVSGGTINNLIDGGTTNNNTDAVLWSSAEAVTDKAYFQWIFPLGRSLICDEFKIKNSGTQANGNGKAQLLTHQGTWIDAGSAVAAGGAAEVTVTVTGADKGGYAGIRFLGTSSTTQTTGRTLEVEFKLANGASDRVAHYPAGGRRRQPLIKADDSSALLAFDTDPYGTYQSSVISEWLFDERTGTTAYDMRGSNHITFDASFQSTYTSSPIWRARGGLRLKKSVIQTAAITGVRTIAMLIWPKMDDTGKYQFCGGSGGAQGYIQNDNFLGTSTCHVSAGEGVAPLTGHVAASTGSVAVQLGNGGPILIFVQLSGAAGSIQYAWGGRPTITTTTDRATDMAIGWAAIYSGTLTDAERLQIKEGVRRLAVERGMIIDYRDCDEIVDGVHGIGQSNGEGDGLIANLSSAYDKVRPTPNTLIAAMARSSATTLYYEYPFAEELKIGHNNYPADYTPPMTHFGVEAGMAWSHEENYANRTRKLAICKGYVSGSIFQTNAESGGTASALSWAVDQSKTSGMLWRYLRHYFRMEASLRRRGIGMQMRAVAMVHGETDSSASIYPTADYYQSALDIFNMVLTVTGYAAVKLIVCRVKAYEAGSPLYPTGLANTRADQASLVSTVNGTASGAVLIDCDDIPFRTIPNNDHLHYSPDGEKTVGQRIYAQVPLG